MEGGARTDRLRLLHRGGECGRCGSFSWKIFFQRWVDLNKTAVDQSCLLSLAAEGGRALFWLLERSTFVVQPEEFDECWGNLRLSCRRLSSRGEGDQVQWEQYSELQFIERIIGFSRQELFLGSNLGYGSAPIDSPSIALELHCCIAALPAFSIAPASYRVEWR